MAEPEQVYDMMGPAVVVGRPAPVASGPAPAAGIVEVPIRPPTGLFSPLTRLVLTCMLSVLGGICAAGALIAFMFMFSLWGGTIDVGLAVGAGVVVTLLGLAISVAQYVPWRKPMRISIGLDAARIETPGFRTPFVVPRGAVRLVDVDARARTGFTDVRRFPIAGDVPDVVRADPLDRYPSSPWEPRDASPVPRDPAATSDPLAPQNLWKDARPPGEEDAGWAAWHPQGRPTAPAGAPAGASERAYLYSGDGSALPVLRFNPGDLPNLALLFDTDLRTPRSPIAFLLAAGPRASVVANRPVRGLLVAVARPEEAEAAFRRWGVVRQVTATDVLEEGLRPPKPVRGLRALVYVVIMTVPLVVQEVLRTRRHRFGAPHGIGMTMATMVVAAAILGVALLAQRRRWQREARRLR